MDKDNGQFKKGHIPWHKGKKGLQINPLKGKKMPEEWKAKLRKPKKTKHVWTDEQKKAQSERFIGKRMGIESSRWKGGDRTRHSALRRKRIREAKGSHTIGEWELLKIQYGQICPCCKQQKQLTEDHIIPLSKGGSNFIENIQPLCLRCNTKKFTKIIKY